MTGHLLDEAQNFLALGLHSYRTVQLYCKKHGLLRGNIPNFEDSESLPCPMCSKPGRCVPVALGFTRDTLPQWVRLVRPVHWDQVKEEK